MNNQIINNSLTTKKIIQLTILSGMLTAISGCGGSSSSSGGNNTDNGDVSSLQVITPKTIYSKSGVAGYSYVVINNPTATVVKNIHYTLSNQIGSGSGASLDPTSAATCATLPAYSKCNVKVTIAPGAVAGSLGLEISNTSLLGKLTKSAKSVDSTPTVGIEQAAYNTASGADGITLSYYHTVINGTPYILVSGLVASNNAGTFNKVVLVNDNGSEIANQEAIGIVSNAQGSTFNILLPVPAGSNTTQTIKVQTQQVANGQTTIVSTATASSTLTTKENIGIAEMLPSAVYLSENNPEQIITFLNTGDAVAQLQQLVSNNPNVEVIFNPISLGSGSTATATFKLKDKTVPAATGDITLTYNNGQTQINISGTVDQNINPTPSPSPAPTPTPPAPSPTPTPPAPSPAQVPGLTAVLSPDNNFFNTTAGVPVSRQLTLTNTGNTPENAIALTLPANFTVTDSGNATSCTVSGNNITNTLVPGGTTGSCTVKVTYTNSIVTPQGSDYILINYNYDNGKPAPEKQTSVNYKVDQSTANLTISPASQDFGSIVNNNTDTSSDVLFTIVNNGDIATDGTSFSLNIDGTDNTMFSMSNTGISAPNQCSTSLAAGASCKVNVKFGPTATPVNPASATLNANYVPYSGQPSTAATSSLSGVSVSAASINISGPDATGFSGSGTSGSPYVVDTNTNGILTYTFTNTGTHNAVNFYITNDTLPAGWTRTGGTCASVTGTDLPYLARMRGENSCTVEYTINSGIAGSNDFNQNVMTEHWTDGANPSGATQLVANGLTYVTVQIPPPTPTITITNLTGNTPASVMGTIPITFTATMTGSGTSTLTATLANSITGTVVSDPSPCALDTSGANSCTFSIVPWNTDFSNSVVGVDGYDPYTPAGTDITLSATNGVMITGVTADTINYTITTPYIYLPQTGQTPTSPITATAGMDGYSHAGIPWAYVSSGSTTPPTRFTVGSGAEEGCITDNLTGLMWVKDLSDVSIKDQLNGTATTWQNALDSIDRINLDGYCGHTDWYLPTINDLVSLINDGYSGNQSEWLLSQGFQGILFSNTYWSSTSCAGTPGCVWSVTINNGLVSAIPTGSNFSVWPVRIK